MMISHLTSGLDNGLLGEVGIAFAIPSSNFQGVSCLRGQALDDGAIALNSPDVFQLENSMA